MSENEQVELVFLKFGLAQTDNEFEMLVGRFLPYILGKVASKDEDIRTKVVQLLNHISNRLKSRPDVKLPIGKLLDLYKESSSSFIVNFTIIYIKLGFPRLDVQEQGVYAPQLFSALEGKPQAHQDSIIRLLISAFPHVRHSENPAERAELFKFHESLQPTKYLLEFCLDVLLMPYSNLSKAVQSSRPATAPAGTATSSSSAPVPFGLSQNAVKRLVGDMPNSSWTVSQVEQYKVGIMNMIGADLFPENDIMMHLIIATSDTRHNVSSKADLELRKRQRSVNWDDLSLVNSMYRLYLGDAQTLTPAQKKKKPSSATLRKPVELRVKLKIIQNLLRSKSATERFPYTIQLVYDALFADTTTARLRTLGIEFMHHISDRCDIAKLPPQSPLLLDAMIKVSKGFENEPRTRGLGFTAMGKLALRVPNLFSANLNLVKDAFEALSKESAQELKLYIQESLAMMSKAYKDVKEEHLPLVEAIITQYISDADHLCRLSAVRYAGIIFSSDHVNSRYLLLLAASDVKEDVASEAKKLLYDWDSTASGASTNEKMEKKLPTFSKMLNFVYFKAKDRMKSSKGFIVGTQSIAFPPSTFAVLLQYLRKCMLHDACKAVEHGSIIAGDVMTEAPVIAEFISQECIKNEESMASLLSKYLELIIQYAKTVTDPDAVYALLEAVATCPETISIDSLLGQDLENKMQWIKSLVHHTRESVRDFGTELYSIILKRKEQDEKSQTEIIAELQNDADSEKNFEKRHGSLLVIGYLLGEWIPNYEGMVPKIMEHAVVTLLKNVKWKDITIASAACFAIGEIARKAELPMHHENSSDDEDDDNEKDKDEPAEKLDPSHPILIPGTFTKNDIVEALLYHVKSSSPHKLREKSVTALGCLPVGDAHFPNREKLLNSLLDSAEIKEPDLHFTVARALSNAALGPKSPACCNRWRLKKRSEQSTDVTDDKLSWLLEKILEEYVSHRIPAVRQAASIWLVTMLKTEEVSSHDAISSLLPRIQSAFMSLLGEADDLVQDIASKALGVVYDLGSEEQKKQLVDVLVQSLMEGNATRSVKPNQSSLFHGDKGVGKAPDGSSLSTYKEICALASDLNQPDLVYKFMRLAKHNSLWNSKKGAAFGFSNIANLAGEQLAPHLPVIIPRLYRYTFDPNQGVRSSMTSIWNALAPDSKKTVDEYLSQITEDLKKNLESSIWRTRQASCLAVADLLRGGRGMQGGKEGDIIISVLPDFWLATLRVMDDIKETVRDAATIASVALKKATIRLCDHDQGKQGEKAVANVLPVLLKYGLVSLMKEVQKLSLLTLIEISKKSGKLIKGCIPEMVNALLEALSGLEPPELNYFAVRSDEDRRDVIDMARVEFVKSTPMMETVNRVLQYVDKETLERLAPSFTDIAKKNYGIMTKAGCSHAVITLVNHCPQDVASFAAPLVNAFTSGLLDNSIAIRKCSADAIGHLAKVSKDVTISKLLTKLKGWYLEKEDGVHRHASAVTYHCIGKHSPDVLKAHATIALPLAFLGMHEMAVDKNGKKEENVNSANARKENKNSPRYLWNDLWTEFTPGTASAIKLYLDELITFSSTALQSPQWKMKAQAAAAMAAIARQQREGTIAGIQLRKLVEILLHGLQGRTWDGKEKLLTAISTVAVYCKSQLLMSEITSVLSLLFKECRRDKVLYRTEAIHSLAAVLEAHKIDKFAPFWDILHPILKKDSEGDDSESDDESNKKNVSNAKMKLLENAIEAVGRSWPHVEATQDEYFDRVAEVLSEHINLSTWNIQSTALRSVKLILRIILESSFAEEKMETENQTECQRNISLKESQLLNAICNSLGNVKYSRIREEAFALVQLIGKLYEKKIFECYGISEIIGALQNSSLSDKRSSKKAAADELIKKLLSIDKEEK